MTVQKHRGSKLLIAALLSAPGAAFAAETNEWEVIARDAGPMWDPVRQAMVKGEQLLLQGPGMPIDGSEDEVPLTIGGHEDEVPVTFLTNGSIYFGDAYVGSWAEAALAPKELGERFARCCKLPSGFFLALKGELSAAPTVGASPALIVSLGHAAALSER
jgi:hypothetical protein